MKRSLIAIFLCLALLPALPCLGASMGEPVDGYSVELAEGLTLTETAWWTGSDLRTEHLLTLEPGSAVRAAVVHGTPLRDRTGLREAAAAEAEDGLHVLAGTNGGYYTVATGKPVGLLVSDGVVRQDAEQLPAIGFLADGGIVYGDPELTFRLTDEAEHTWEITAVNGDPGDGLRLYTADMGRAIPVEGACCALCRIRGALTMCGSAELTVERVFTGEEPVTPEKNRVLLVWQPREDDPLAELCEDDWLTLASDCAPDWAETESAVGILYVLLEDGTVQPELERTAAPRTVIGVREDGTLVLLTVDGRQPGYSTGAGLELAALRMQELGCVWAGALDGGGSTQLAAQMPGDDSLTTVNRPSDGTPRRVVDYVLFGTEEESENRARYLKAYPLHIQAVAGAEIPLTVTATDRYGYSAKLRREVSFTVTEGLGEVTDGVFHAAGTGSGTITVSADGLKSASIPIRVTESPEKIELYGEVYGKLTKSLTLDPGQEVDLTVRSTDHHVLLAGDDTCYTWTLDPAAGTVDETGHLIPGEYSGTGLLCVTAGETREEIPITVWSGVPFSDIARGDPYFEAVRWVWENGVFEGNDDGTFAPDEVMNRAMLVTVLWRICGCPAAETAPAFTDVAPDAWYADSVAWAAEHGIVLGYDAETFGPEDDLTEEQILTILHRYAGLPAAETERVGTYPDGDTAAAYALPALNWALETGILSPETELHPAAPMPRVGVAEVLMRWRSLPEPEAAEEPET